MFASKEIVAIIFKAINFAALVWIFKYAFQNYLLPGLKEKLAAKFALFKRLEDKNQDLALQVELVDKESKDQEKLFELLKEKIKTWDQEVKKQENKDMLDQQKINNSHKIRIEIQAQNIHSQKLLSEVFPRVIAGTFKQLEQKFKQEQEAEKFFRNIIDYMKTSTEQAKESR